MQGAVVLGKTNMAEFALRDLECKGSLFGQVLNPYNLSRTPAGEHATWLPIYHCLM